jgi:hypothetical protein
VVTPNGGTPSVTITPASNQLGVAKVSVTVSDNDLAEPKTTTANFTFMVRPNTNVLAIDYFSYDNSGSLGTQSGGYWQHLSGNAGQIQVVSGVVTIDTANETEGLQAALLGAPYATNSGAVLYSSFIVNVQDFTKLPIKNGAYFALFNDGSNNGNYEGRLIAATNGAAPGNYRLGITSFGSVATNSNTQMFPQDLLVGNNYTVVTALVLTNGHPTLWINPSSQSSPSVTVTNNASVNGISTYAFRTTGGSAGVVSLSYLKIGTTFDSVFPSLSVQPSGTNVIVNWSDPTLGIQSTTNLSSPFADVLGATPPYTNNASTNNTLFFRFGQ